MAKLPRPRVDVLSDVDPALVEIGNGTVLWRIHRTTGPHVLAWNELRAWGPTSARFDPHEPPACVQPDRAVTYVATDLPTALAEVFQVNRRIDRQDRAPHLTAFHPARALALLDLTGDWPIRAGASHAINTGRKDVTRAWARVFARTWPKLDGLCHTSSMTGRPMITVFAPAADLFPARPAFSMPLSAPALTGWLADAARQIGYGLV